MIEAKAETWIEAEIGTCMGVGLRPEVEAKLKYHQHLKTRIIAFDFPPPELFVQTSRSKCCDHP